MTALRSPEEHPGPPSCEGWIIVAGDESGDYEERDVDAETPAERASATVDASLCGVQS